MANAIPADASINQYHHRRPSIQTYTGVEFYPLEPERSEIRAADIAHALSMKVRFTGHVRRFYSVAQHCCHVSDDLEPLSTRLAFAGLLHDAAEAYLPDVASPIKPHLPGFREVEDRVEAAIFARFGVELSDADRSAIKRADVEMFLAEREVLMRKVEWWSERRPLPRLVNTIRETVLTPAHAERAWLRRMECLEEKLRYVG